MEIDVEDLKFYDELLDNDDVECSQDYSIDMLKNADFWKSDGYNSPFGGSMGKIFLRCDSKYFEELISLLRKKDNYYVTYLNRLCKTLNSSKTKDFPLPKISIMLKGAHWDTGAMYEEICSKVANALGFPTVYNRKVKISGNDVIMSVDALNKNEVLISQSFKDVLPFNFNIFEHGVRAILQHCVNHNMMTNDNMEELMESFVENYIFRRLILRDSDFKGNNLNLIHNDRTNRYSWFPNYDYELANSLDMMDVQVMLDLKEINRQYPEVLDSVMNKVWLRFRKLENLMDNDSDNSICYDDFLQRIVNVHRLYEKVKNIDQVMF